VKGNVERDNGNAFTRRYVQHYCSDGNIFREKTRHEGTNKGSRMSWRGSEDKVSVRYKQYTSDAPSVRFSWSTLNLNFKLHIEAHKCSVLQHLCSLRCISLLLVPNSPQGLTEALPFTKKNSAENSQKTPWSAAKQYQWDLQVITVRVFQITQRELW